MDATLDIKPPIHRASSYHFRVVLLSVFLDRFAFYGLRGVIIYYAVTNLNIAQDEAMYYYGFYMLVSSFASLIGGLISDFLTGPKIAMILGTSLCVIGGALSLVENPTTFVIAMMLLLLGTGFFRSGSFSFIGHISQKNNVILEKRFILHYAVINLGAFLSALTIGTIGIYFGYFHSIIAVCILYALSLIILLLLRNTKEKHQQFEKSGNEAVQLQNNIKFVILAIIGTAFFWLIFELYGNSKNYSALTDEISLFGFQIPKSLLYLTSSLLSTLLLIPYYFLAKKLSITFKIALGCILLAALWMIWTLFFTSNVLSLGLLSLLIVGFIEAIIDLFVTPTMMTLICRYSPKKIYGTLFGIYSLLCFAGIKLGTFLAGEDISMTAKIILGVALIGVAIYFLLLPNEFKTKKAAPVERLEEI